MKNGIKSILEKVEKDEKLKKEFFEFKKDFKKVYDFLSKNS